MFKDPQLLKAIAIFIHLKFIIDPFIFNKSILFRFFKIKMLITCSNPLIVQFYRLFKIKLLIEFLTII